MLMLLASAILLGSGALPPGWDGWAPSEGATAGKETHGATDAQDAPDDGDAVEGADALAGRAPAGSLGELIDDPSTFMGSELVDERMLAALEGLGDAASYESHEEDLDLPGAATEILEGYRDQGCTLHYADYLGVLGDVWGCVVEGERWVEMCVVREAEGAAVSRVEVVRFDADGWERLLAESEGHVEPYISSANGMAEADGDDGQTGSEALAESPEPEGADADGRQGEGIAEGEPSTSDGASSVGGAS